MIVFVAGERRAMALDRIGDEQGRLVVFSTVERLDQRLDAMPAEIGHELGQRLVIKAVEQLFDVRFLADIGEQPFAPRRSAMIGQRRIIGVGAAIDPFLTAVAAGALERLALPLAIFEGDTTPAAARKSDGW